MHKDDINSPLSENALFIKQWLEIEVFPNLSQEVIMTTKDRLKICLSENLKKAEKKHDWIAPFTLLIAVITAFVTASFKDYGFAAKTWEAIFIILGLSSVIWLIISIRHAFVKVDIEQIIEEIKTNTKNSNHKL